MTAVRSGGIRKADAEPTIRPEIREEGVRTEGIRRRKRTDGGGNEFDIPEHMKPRGMSVEWKTISILGKPVDNSILASYEEQGWQPATVEQFPKLVSKNYTDKVIVRKGMMLMIRPQEFTDEAKAEDLTAAREQVADKLKQLGQTAKGEMDRKVMKVNRDFERPPVDD